MTRWLSSEKSNYKKLELQLKGCPDAIYTECQLAFNEYNRLYVSPKLVCGITEKLCLQLKCSRSF